jgi:hypothetical protein
MAPKIPVVAITSEAPGAIPNGTRIVKIACDPGGGDRHPVGAQGKVLGSMKNPGTAFPKVKYMYCLEWDDMPGVPVFAADWKIARIP